LKLLDARLMVGGDPGNRVYSARIYGHLPGFKDGALQVGRVGKLV
jgi:hypothetical protein